MDLSAVQTPLAGLLAGLVTSVHCVGMCGPLACAVIPGKAPGKGSPQLALGAYHLSRLLSYGFVGALAGVMGASAAQLFSFSVISLLPWAFVVLFLVFIFGWEKKAILPDTVSRWVFRLRLRAGKWGGTGTGATLGLLTPLLPCAPLYILFGVALFSGCAFSGAILLFAFAIGTAGPLWLLQSQFFRIRARFTPRTLGWIQKSLAVVSLVLITWRAGAGDGFNPESATAVSCPFH
jgi:uncharacterized protein